MVLTRATAQVFNPMIDLSFYPRAAEEQGGSINHYPHDSPNGLPPVQVQFATMQLKMAQRPLVSIVTPSLNMAGFLPQTIESVLSQDYPEIEYVVMDGGSTDGTIEILKRYGDRLRYVSEPDGGAADAINRGFQACRGSILAWLNADDTYTPGAVSAAVRKFVDTSEAEIVYGEACWTDPEARVIGPYPVRVFDRERLLHECYICQPACFFRRSAFERVGGLNANLQIVFDYDLWIRLSEHHHFFQLDRQLANSRMHTASKTLGSRKQMYQESFQIFKRHSGYIPFRWIHGYCCYMLDGRDQFYEPLQPSFLKYLLSLPVGCWHNRGNVLRFAGEWYSEMTWAGLIRRLKGSARPV
jgi:glycosyltransferase involved in cell wall biosynthesis